jgi:hypothetical protein
MQVGSKGEDWLGGMAERTNATSFGRVASTRTAGNRCAVQCPELMRNGAGAYGHERRRTAPVVHYTRSA